MEKPGKILVVDDDTLVLEALLQAFMDDYEVVSASSGKQALEVVSTETDIEAIILDIKMARMDGL